MLSVLLLQVLFMKKVVETGEELNDEERNLLSGKEGRRAPATSGDRRNRCNGTCQIFVEHRALPEARDLSSDLYPLLSSETDLLRPARETWWRSRCCPVHLPETMRRMNDVQACRVITGYPRQAKSRVLQALLTASGATILCSRSVAVQWGTKILWAASAPAGGLWLSSSSESWKPGPFAS